MNRLNLHACDERQNAFDPTQDAIAAQNPQQSIKAGADPAARHRKTAGMNVVTKSDAMRCDEGLHGLFKGPFT
jgi:hypothetical protein